MLPRHCRHWVKLSVPIAGVFLFFASVAIAVADIVPQRSAIAISGGASKGAYEAGLNWAIIKTALQAEIQQQLPLGSDIRPIAAAGIAGTSAGGINTLLSALTWCVVPEADGGFPDRIDDNIFRDVWLTPDVNQLLPADYDSPQYLPDDALLSRKALVATADGLRQKWRRPGTFRPGVRIPLGVSVTRVEPENINLGGIIVQNQRFYIPFEMRTRADGSAHFAFNPKDYPQLRNPDLILMPFSAKDTPFAVSDQQVLDAILTTSAFPIGFGRKRLLYCSQSGSGEKDQNGGQPAVSVEEKNENGLMCPDGFTMREAEFSDGGLFDNLPIGLARQLAESGADSQDQSMPVNYVYIDPNRQRFQTPIPEEGGACDSDQPPPSCRTMTFDLASEAAVLGGALGTARKFELYRELTSDHWRLNLSQLSRKAADLIESEDTRQQCTADLPYFDHPVTCSDAFRQTALLLERAYDYPFAPIADPFSTEALKRSRVAAECRPSSAHGDLNISAECRIDALRLRRQLADAVVTALGPLGSKGDPLANDVRKSRLDMDYDRIIRVTSRGAPITGTLLGDFGAFLDYKFREYDYYVGIYDAVVFTAQNQCALSYSSQFQPSQYQTCVDRVGETIYGLLQLADAPKGRYVFARLAQREFGPQGRMAFAWDPLPAEDRDMRIIHDGLAQSLSAYRRPAAGVEEALSAEREFFEHLKRESFVPTAPAQGRTALLALIMDDPEYWAQELVNRVTNRIVYLETEAEHIYATRDPDPDKRENAYPVLMGSGALALRTATYKYPPFTFAPSTAPESWGWRNVIPYEVAFDVADSDLLFLWQPTWNVGRNNLGARFGLGFAGGVLNSRSVEEKNNYGTIGFDYTRLTKSALISGWGLAPAVFHNWSQPEGSDQTTLGADAHLLFLKNRLRVGLGVRDFGRSFGDTWFLTIGLTDLPGFCYWLSR